MFVTNKNTEHKEETEADPGNTDETLPSSPAAPEQGFVSCPCSVLEAVIRELSRHQVEMEVGGETTDSEPKPMESFPMGPPKPHVGKGWRHFSGRKTFQIVSFFLQTKAVRSAVTC